MLKPTVRNLYQLMSVQAELHDPVAARYYSYNKNCRFLLVKTPGNIFEVDLVPDNSCVLRIVKNCVTQAYAYIPQFGETRVYKSSIRVTD